MKTITESNENYSIIDLTLEYENWTGTERYAVISDFDQEYLEQNYSSELRNTICPIDKKNNADVTIRANTP